MEDRVVSGNDCAPGMTASASEQITRLRIATARSEEGLQTVTGIVGRLAARMEAIEARQNTFDLVSAERGHHLRSVMMTLSEMRERLGRIEERRPILERIEIGGPLALLIVAIVYRLIGGDVNHLLSLVGK